MVIQPTSFNIIAAINGEVEQAVTGHIMDGIPVWMGMAGMAIIIISSHLIVHFLKGQKKKGSYRKINLLRFKPLKNLVKRPWFPLMMQSVSLITFLFVLAAGLIGHDKNNIGPVLTWTWWWILLIFLTLGFGKAFCMICPWEALSSIMTSLSHKSRIKMLGYEKPWPKWARNIFPAIIFFAILTWFELGHDITKSASMTAILGLVMVGMAVFCALIFEKRAFCRYGCLVGRISGLYSMFSPLELRSESADVCASCKTKECYKGSETTTKCPTGLFPSKLTENSYCTLCTECIRSCPHDNLTINYRLPNVELLRRKKFKWDEATLAIVLLALTSFHGLTMTPFWTQSTNALRATTGFGPMTVFTVFMILMIALPITLFWVGSAIARVLSRDKKIKTGDIFKAFAYSLIPIALFYHLAHNCMHFFMEGQHLIPLLSDPLGWGWDLFGTAKKTYDPFLSVEVIWCLQVICVVVGHIYGVVLADRYARTLFTNKRAIFLSLIPLLLTMILYSAFSMWLIMQPMDMRSGM